MIAHVGGTLVVHGLDRVRRQLLEADGRGLRVVGDREHHTVAVLDQLVEGAPAEGWSEDVELTLRTLEISAQLGG